MKGNQDTKVNAYNIEALRGRDREYDDMMHIKDARDFLADENVLSVSDLLRCRIMLQPPTIVARALLAV